MTDQMSPVTDWLMDIKVNYRVSSLLKRKAFMIKIKMDGQTNSQIGKDSMLVCII